MTYAPGSGLQPSVLTPPEPQPFASFRIASFSGRAASS